MKYLIWYKLFYYIFVLIKYLKAFLTIYCLIEYKIVEHTVKRNLVTKTQNVKMNI